MAIATSLRLKLTELCARSARPLVDLASDTGGQGDELWYGRRVAFANAAGGLFCQNLLDQQKIARDRHVARAARGARAHLRRRARCARRDRTVVVSVNGVVASLAVTEFTVFATGMPAPAAQIICRGETPVVRRVVDEPAKARATCDHDAVDPCRLRLATARR